MDRDVLLLGSVGLPNAEEVFRAAGSILGTLAPRLPDGESGWARSVWIQCQRPFFLANPALEMVEPDPDRLGVYRPARVPSAGIYGHTQAESYHGRARLRPGLAAADVHFNNLGYADWAIESYGIFARLKSEGVIAARTRFQVSLPTPANILNLMALPEALAAVTPAYEAALFREIERMAAAIPANQLAIQWDTTHPPVYESADAEQRSAIVQRLIGLSEHVPAGVDVGYHLCYGDFEHKHGVQPKDLTVCVEMANAIVAGSSREVTWVHMPIPRDRADEAFVAPLRDLRLGAAPQLYLGLVHYTDGLVGTRRRIETANRVRTEFGIATECGLGRRLGQDIPELLRIHAEAARTAPVGSAA